MKVALFCSSGGHMSEMMMLKGAWGKYDHFFITYDAERTREITDRKYLIKFPEEHPLSYPFSIMKVFKILFVERPDAAISTGFGWMDVWLFFFSKLMGIKTTYIESWCMTDNITGTAKVVKLFADDFMVQWPELAEKLGDGTHYRGGVV